MTIKSVSRPRANTGPIASALLPVGAWALTCGLAAGAAAQTPTVGPVRLVAQGSIFATCTADHVGSQPGTNFPGANIEPNLAINPANPKNFLVGIQQDRWSNGGARGLRGAYSFDGGSSTFGATTTPGVTQCQGGPWPRASDPWVAFSPDGTAYFSELVTEELANPNLFGHNGQTVSQSTNGGLNWGAPITLIDTPRQPDQNKPQALNDKNSVTADPTSSDYAYVVWDKLTSFVVGYGLNDERGGDDSGQPSGPIGSGPPAAPSAAPEVAAASTPVSHDVLSITRRLRDEALRGRPFGKSAASLARLATASGSAAAPVYPTYVTGPSYFSRTTDHGHTWEKPKIIFDPGSNFQTIANQIVAIPGGDILDFFTQQNDLSGADTIGWVRSSDRGKTWSPGYQALTLVNVAAVTPNKQQAIRSADILFGLGLDRTNNIIYVTWQDSRFTGQSEAVLSFSADGGYSWYGPVRVNQTPRNPSHPLFQQALIPSVTAVADGTVVVTYYDFRNDKVGATTDFADYWAVFCNPLTSADACQSNTDWKQEVRLTEAPFDLDNAPVAEGHFLGDYMGLKATGQTAFAVFGTSPATNITKDWGRAITVPTGKAVASR